MVKMLVTGCISYMEVTVQTKDEKIYGTQHGGGSQPVDRGNYSTGTSEVYSVDQRRSQI
jgi:hypothetical protein